MNETKSILTLKEAAEYCGYSVDGFWHICQQPTGPRFSQQKKWGRLRFRRQWLDEWLDGGRTRPEPTEKKSKKKTVYLSPSSHRIDLDLLKIGNRNK